LIRNRRVCRRAAIVLSALTVAGASAKGAALFHATLLRSTPAADAKLSKPPASIRLLFSEEVVPALSQITVIGPAGDSARLQVTSDPHDVHALVGTVPPESGGRYTVYWRVVSADGHPVDGSFSYSVRTTAVVPPVAGPPPPADTRVQRDTAVRASVSQNAESVPVPAALFRGVGLGALMAAMGILFFGITARGNDTLIPRSLVVSLTAAGVVLLAMHLAAWLVHISPPTGLTGQFVASVLGSKIGRVELVRTVFAVLALLALAPLGSEKIALFFGTACLVMSGAIGHPAAIDPVWAIPAKSIHLLAGALWLGGLIWMLITGRSADTTRRREALRVSSLALMAVIAVLLSGLLQTALFLSTPADLLGSAYGKLVVAKIVGLLILIAYGIYNRYSLLPRFADGGTKLRGSVRQEIFVVALLIIIGGFLGYIPPPPSATTSVRRGIE
jgi:copper transport protein